MPDWNVPQEQITEDSAEHSAEYSPTESSPRQMEAYNRVLRSVFFNEKKSELFPSYLEVTSQWRIFDFSSIIIETEKETEKNQDRNEAKREDKKDEMKGREELLSVSSGSSVSVSLDEAITLEKKEVEKEVEKEVVRLLQYPIGSSIESIVNSRI